MTNEQQKWGEKKKRLKKALIRERFNDDEYFFFSVCSMQLVSSEKFTAKNH